MTERATEVPIDLQHSFSEAEGQMDWATVLKLMPPEECPGCPKCGQRLDVMSVGVDGRGNLTAAKMMCRKHQPVRYYVFESATGEVFFDGCPEMEDTDD